MVSSLLDFSSSNVADKSCRIQKMCLSLLLSGNSSLKSKASAFLVWSYTPDEHWSYRLTPNSWSWTNYYYIVYSISLNVDFEL